MAKVNAIKGTSLEGMDTSGDGKVSRKEMRQAKRAARKNATDTDGDGKVSWKEKQEAAKQVKDDWKNQKTAEKQGFTSTEQMKEYNSGNASGEHEVKADYGTAMAKQGDAANNYLQTATDINNSYKQDVQKLMNDANTSIGDFQSQINNLRTQYQGALDQYAGKNGYNNMLQQAQQGATQSAANAGSVVQGNARSMGMSKAAAAAMGAGSVVNAYNAGLDAQQNQVGNMYNNALAGASNTLNAGMNGATTALGNQMNVFNSGMGAAGQVQSSAQQAALSNIGNLQNWATISQAGRNNQEKTWGSDGVKGNNSMVMGSNPAPNPYGSQPMMTSSDANRKCDISKIVTDMNDKYNNYGKKFRSLKDLIIHL